MKKAQNKNNTGTSAGTIAAVAAGVAALAAGSYYFFGPEGKKNRGKLKGWMIRMKGEIVEKMENAKDLTEDVYARIVDSVAAKYAKGSKIAEADIKALADSLKSQWKGISRSAAPKKTAAAKKAPAKKTAPKTAAKKAAKKA